jgi:predicted RNA methylase
MARSHKNPALFELEPPVTPQGPVECLGMSFESDAARRDHFTALLREKLEELEAILGGVLFTTVGDVVERMKVAAKWPMGDETHLHELAQRMAAAHRKERGKDLLQLWKDEVGFPHGTIDDILRLSDPPYYTACPNPFLSDFLSRHGTPHDPTRLYSREPFAADVSEGKNDPIYNAHSYHTKVPHKAIMRYILHYTEPGDVVLDGFCGTGMTGVAAQLCGDCKTVESLGYRVDDRGLVYRKEEETDEAGDVREVWKPFSQLGPRCAVLNDLSPAAAFIAYNYNMPLDVRSFESEARRILAEVEDEWDWMYATLAYREEEEAQAWAERLRACRNADEARQLVRSIPDGGRINYTVWSDVFVCPECTNEVVFWEAAVDKEAGRVRDQFPCPHCAALLSKRTMERAWVTRYDKVLGQTIRQAKQVPVLVNYTFNGERREKAPDAFDLALIEKIEALETPCWFPTERMPEGDEARRNDEIGLTHVHHFYTKRSLWALGALYEAAFRLPSQFQRIIAFFVQYSCLGFAKISRYAPKHYSQVNRYLSGTLYVGSQQVEVSPAYILAVRPRRIARALLERGKAAPFLVSSANLAAQSSAGSTVDYVFTDPPFGGNLMYSELNFLWEAWLRVFTNSKPEAIENAAHGKGLPEYQRLMTECFKEYHRVLKPGRWMTVEFHNSKNAVWNAIQEALEAAGFVVADVRTLDKQQGSFKQVTSPNAVKQDLVISCYKPGDALETRFEREAGTEEGVWDFIRTHLRQLPVVVEKGAELEVVAERQAYLLYDRMVAFHVQRGVTVPLSAAEFYAGLAERFSERDGMYFLPEQVAEYDRRRLRARKVHQLHIMVIDEASAIQWLEQQLSKKPQTFQEIQPQFLREVAGWQKHEKPLELSVLLEQNFLCYDARGEVPSQIHSYLSSNFKELRNLAKDDQRLRAKAKDRWYVPDPNKAGDLEKLRERALLREFEEYRQSRQKRLKVFRVEAMRAGFRKAWQERDYATIIEVARKIPGSVLQEDQKLLMWYEQALTRSGQTAGR